MSFRKASLHEPLREHDAHDTVECRDAYKAVRNSAYWPSDSGVEREVLPAVQLELGVSVHDQIAVSGGAIWRCAVYQIVSTVASWRILRS